jgi:molybdate transport system substrate-binding protein
MNLTSVLANVVSRETDVREVLAKIALGEGDAGFVYSTDAKTVPGKVRTLRIPAWAQPKVQYGICVVSASSNKAAARALVKRVTGSAGQKILVRYGFLPRVKPKARH